MPLPQFIKAGVETVTVSRLNTFPAANPKVLNQYVGISDANTVKVAVFGTPLGSIPLTWEGLTQTDLNNLTAFFEDPRVNYGKNPFTFMDSLGVSHTVQYLEPQWAPMKSSANNGQLNIILTVVG
jgi:hypothetical protein